MLFFLVNLVMGIKSWKAAKLIVYCLLIEFISGKWWLLWTTMKQKNLYFSLSSSALNVMGANLPFMLFQSIHTTHTHIYILLTVILLHNINKLRETAVHVWTEWYENWYKNLMTRTQYCRLYCVHVLCMFRIRMCTAKPKTISNHETIGDVHF